jgi:hypothetical protein
MSRSFMHAQLTLRISSSHELHVVGACQVKALLSLADACEPAAIRCRILQELPLVCLRRKSHYQEEYDDEHYYNDDIDENALVALPLPSEYVDVALAAITVRFISPRENLRHAWRASALSGAITHTLAGCYG